LKFGGDSRPELICVYANKTVWFYSICDLKLRFEAKIKLKAKLNFACSSFSYILLILEDRLLCMIDRVKFTVLVDFKKTASQALTACFDDTRGWFIIGGTEGYDALLRPASGKWDLEKLTDKPYPIMS
jgi:hypothetical protein